MTDSLAAGLFRPSRLLLLINLFLACCIILAIYFDQYWLIALPAVFLLGFVLLRDLRFLYIIMMMSVPISIEYSIGSFTLDAPDELLNIFFLALMPGFLLFNYKNINFSFVRHPIVLFLAASFLLSIITTIFSVNVFLSVKYLLAKAWYIVAYFGMTALFIKSWKDVKTLAIAVGFTAVLTMVYVMSRHAVRGFSFDSINSCVGPFYSNHVNYAIQLLVIFPLIWLLGRIHQLKWKQNYLYIALMLLFIAGIYFSYTRAAIGALLLLIPFYYIVKWKLMKPAIILSIIGVFSYSIYLIKDNKFFDYAPDYNKTISHTDFNTLLTATYNFEDISTMERVYRWVAARYMIADRPMIGVGPNNFYDTYSAYTLKSFRTYVSDNPDHSTVHSYFMLLAIEQGILAPILFVWMVAWAMIAGQRMYHRETDKRNQYVIMAAMMILFAMLVVLTINDVIESDKEGSFFYVALALIMRFHWKSIKGTDNPTSPETGKAQ
ncbi:MAG: O-antigen ligase family protein [Saprospiraceae bacterium]|nr:O-antigen ligase family protein [Saprospiraceae bacterium]MBX7179767.1 O-antigen ligase family protein [Saprospiraceae bacterium]MCB0592240.1 O-antigen ligase family protein [Saprospiraceae bacterium]MCO5284140.1 O-antigen ligase family protein [Saprospiraceae bacterium]MCO6471670.1 O-antigen ligase family protein [Saprospiraceae bacterium]